MLRLSISEVSATGTGKFPPKNKLKKNNLPGWGA